MPSRKAVYVAFWHNPDLHIPAPEGPITSGLPTLGAKGQRRPWLTVEALKELLAARQK